MTALVLWHTTRRVVPAGGVYAGMPVNGDRPGAYHVDGQLWQRLNKLALDKAIDEALECDE